MYLHAPHCTSGFCEVGTVVEIQKFTMEMMLTCVNLGSLEGKVKVQAC